MSLYLADFNLVTRDGVSFHLIVILKQNVKFSLKWYENCILSIAGTAATFAITFVPAVTLKIEDNAKLSKLLSERLKRSVYWNKYQVILKYYVANSYIRERLDANFQGLIDCLFLLMRMVIISLMKIHIENIFFHGLK